MGEHSTEILLNALPATKVLPLSTLTAASMVIAELSSEVYGIPLLKLTALWQFLPALAGISKLAY